MGRVGPHPILCTPGVASVTMMNATAPTPTVISVIWHVARTTPLLCWLVTTPASVWWASPSMRQQVKTNEIFFFVCFLWRHINHKCSFTILHKSISQTLADFFGIDVALCRSLSPQCSQDFTGVWHKHSCGILDTRQWYSLLQRLCQCFFLHTCTVLLNQQLLLQHQSSAVWRELQGDRHWTGTELSQSC